MVGLDLDLWLMQVASNGLEALEKVRKVSRLDGQKEGQMFDCILMDLEMPGERYFVITADIQ